MRQIWNEMDKKEVDELLAPEPKLAHLLSERAVCEEEKNEWYVYSIGFQFGMNRNLEANVTHEQEFRGIAVRYMVGSGKYERG